MFNKIKKSTTRSSLHFQFHFLHDSHLKLVLEPQPLKKLNFWLKKTLKLIGLHSRFNDDDNGPITTGGTTTSFTNNNGVFQSTSSVTNPDGSVTTTRGGNSGKNFRTIQMFITHKS